MAKKSATTAYTQLRSCYKQYVAAQLQSLITAHIQSQKISMEEEVKYQAMWQIMLSKKEDTV